ncbi:MAG: ABC transporter ATP-binding protein [Anaerolineae bacterium]|nr:ABC transporter ATP-binding protein [Thermoflexales bacterium]MDW8406840.1 ABC transporter ATP-binding protein [Anaerolineae bacterium]
MLSVRNLSITFAMYEAGLRRRAITPIAGLDLDVRAGELLGVIGASGSGKSLLAHAVLGILPSNASAAGQIWFKGELLTPARQEALRGKEIALIPQSVGFLDPLMRVGRQVRRAAQLSGASSPVEAQRRIFERYGLRPQDARLYPFQLSGGMARRVLVSTAAVGQASLIIADEPTPGLHPEVVAETLRHMRELADEGRAVLLITHDVGAALTVADRIAVFYAGTTVEVAPVADFQGDGAALRHPYTRALWRALPQNEFISLPGAQPTPDDLPAGCLFAPRCPLATAECRAARPELRPVRGGWARCIHVES